MKTDKENIINYAAKLFISKGYEGTSTREIADAAGLANASCLFSRFRSKEEIYHKVVEKYIINAQTPEQKFGDCKNCSLYDFIEYYIQKVNMTMEFLAKVFQSGNKAAIQYFSFSLECATKYGECAKAILAFNQKELELWEKIIQNARQTGEIRSNVNTKTLAEIFRYAFLGISYVFSLKGGANINELKSILYSIYDTVKTIK